MFDGTIEYVTGPGNAPYNWYNENIVSKISIHGLDKILLERTTDL